MNDFFKKHREEIEKFHSGDSAYAYRFLGAHIKGNGVEFAVFAPSATSVSVCGDFNNWDREKNKAQCEYGIWYAFVEGIGKGDIYKYYIENNGYGFLKADPYAFKSQLRPNTASVVWDIKKPVEDEEYNSFKENRNIYESPVNIYEVHLGSFMQKEDGEFYTYREIAPKLTNYLLQMGYNFVEFMPLSEYPLDASWGYQTTGYYSITGRYGTPEDFQYLVEFLHSAKIGVILDWVPGHFCRDDHGLRLFDGTPLYEYHNEFLADNPGWGTLNFDFTKPQVVSFLVSNAVFLMEMYNIDGIRADAVANVLSNIFCKDPRPELMNNHGGFDKIEGIEFIKKLNSTVKRLFKNNLMFAEDSSQFPRVTGEVENGGLGFTFKWNMGWMNDSLSYMKLDPLFRKGSHDKVTFPLFYAFNENFVLPLSHDEVVHGKCSMVEKMPGCRVDKFAQLRAYILYMYTMPGKKLMFMGNEFAHALEWRFYESLEWNLLQYDEYARERTCISDINHMYLKNKCLWDNEGSWDGFSWCNANDRDKSVLSYARYSKDKSEFLVTAINFTPVRQQYKLGIPKFCDYEEILNTDNIIYGGGNGLNRGVIAPCVEPEGEMPFSVNITLPAFGGVVLKSLPNQKNPRKG